MSDAEKQGEEQTENKKGSPLGIIFIVLVLLAVILGLGAYKNAQKNEVGGTDVAQDAVPNEEYVETIASEDGSDEQQETSDVTSDENAKTAETNVSDFDLEAAATPRILGNPEAPVKISEHSSFTCPGCAAFHEENFKKLKKDYIDTGKAYIVFDDFPRNRYDLTVGAIARCVPDESYFNFVQLLFETQESWLNTDYIKHVKQNAMLSGATEDQISQCLGNTDLYEVLANRASQASDDYQVKSTPTLVINETQTISGLQPYEKIKAALDNALAKAAE